MILVLVRRSRKVVPEELVTLMSWGSRDFLVCLVIVVWKKKDGLAHYIATTLYCDTHQQSSGQ